MEDTVRIRSCFRDLIPAVTRSCIAAPLAGFWAELRRKSLKGIFRVSAGILDVIDFAVEKGAMAEYIFFLIPVGRGVMIEETAIEVQEYRSIRFEHEVLETDNYQGNAVVNFTDRETPYTRIIEHKWFEFGCDAAGHPLPHTVISREYSSEWKQPYYPVNDECNAALYRRYRELAGALWHVIFCGRLAEYRYYDMDAVVARAMAAWEDVKAQD